MPSKVEVGPGDIRPQTLAWLGVGLALIAAVGMSLSFIPSLGTAIHNRPSPSNTPPVMPGG